MGLAELKAKREAEQARKAGTDRPEVNWLRLNPGEKVEVRFLQELDDEFAEAYQVPEWTINGNGQFRTLVDTEDTEGECYAAEFRRKLQSLASSMSESERKAFYEKYGAKKHQKLYFNVEKVNEPGKTYAFAQSISGALVETLLEDQEEEGNITGNVYRLSKGPAKSDSWTARRLKADVEQTDAQPYEISHLARFIPLADQRKYLEKLEPVVEDAPVVSKPVAADVDSDW